MENKNDVYRWTLEELRKQHGTMTNSDKMEQMVKERFGWDDDIESEAWRAWETHDGSAASGAQMPSMYYLKPENVIHEPKYNHHYKITRFDNDSVFFVPASELMAAEAEKSMIFPMFVDMMNVKTINIEGHPYETDRDKILLENEIVIIKRAEEIKGLVEEKGASEQKVEAIQEAHEALQEQHDAHLESSAATIEGMEELGTPAAAKGMKVLTKKEFADRLGMAGDPKILKRKYKEYLAIERKYGKMLKQLDNSAAKGKRVNPDRVLKASDAKITIVKKPHGRIVFVNGQTAFNLDDKGGLSNELRKENLIRAYKNSK